MPGTRVLYYREGSRVPMVEWLETLEADARRRCQLRLERLRAEGHALRRPVTDHVVAGIFELRTRHLRVHYRMLYFFHGRAVVVVSHGLAKSGAAIPYEEIRRALDRKMRYEADPDAHTFSGRNEP